VLAPEYLPANAQKTFEMNESCATRSQKFIESAGLPALVLGTRLLRKPCELIRGPRQLFLPGRFILQSFDDLRGDGVLLLFGKGGNFPQGVF